MSTNQIFLNHILQGFNQKIKRISSLYFYDEEGSKIFQEIMKMPEYYLPRTERELLLNESENIAYHFADKKVNVIELGAGDGSKTRILLNAMEKVSPEVIYIPMDIDKAVLEENRISLIKENNNVQVNPIAGNYFETLNELNDVNGRKLLLFLGSNLGNFTEERTLDFLQMVFENLESGDFFLLGVDLRKHPNKIIKAYDDPHGITAKFNLNLLIRINKELSGDFKLEQFEHYATYNPLSGLAQSFLVSNVHQYVSIGDCTFEFKEGEVIHTENSKKYTIEEIMVNLIKTGFSINDQEIFEKEGYALFLAKKF